MKKCCFFDCCDFVIEDDFETGFFFCEYHLDMLDKVIESDSEFNSCFGALYFCFASLNTKVQERDARLF